MARNTVLTRSSLSLTQGDHVSEATTDTTASSSAGTNKGVKRGLPLEGLPDAAKSAAALWEVARLGLAPKKAFAEKLGRKSTSGGGWDRLIAVLRGFGLIRLDGEQIGLSPLGQELVNGTNQTQQMAARRTALLHLKAYRELVDSFDGTELPDNTTLASRLKFEYGKSDDFAVKAAQAFLDSLAFAAMVDTQRCVRRSGADAAVDPKANVAEEDEQADLIDGAFGNDDETDDLGGNGEDNDVRDDGEEPVQTFLRSTRSADTGRPASVTISVTLDLSKYRADEVVQILKVLNG